MTTLKELIASVTDLQLSKCHRIVGTDGRTFYQVDNERNELDGDGLTIEYTVRFTPGKGFTCTCPSGQEGFRSCTHGCCKHVRWIVRHNQVWQQEQAHLEKVARLESMGLTLAEAKTAASAQLLINGEPASDAVLVRVFGPDNRRPSELEIEHAAELYESRAWRLMR